MSRKPFWLLMSVVLLVPVASSQTIRVYQTTPDLRQVLQQQPGLSFGNSESGALVINVNEAVTYQQMDGFGASMTESSAWLIQTKLSQEQRELLMRLLFDHAAGIGMSFLRQPMGASDFVLERYNYADEADPELADFSLAHDQLYVAPLLKQAIELNPRQRIMATPWSPPGWMKTSGSMLKGSLLKDAYAPLAKYFVKFVQSYEALGIPIYAVSVQNEPTWAPADYPGMSMKPDEQVAFVRDQLGPAFASAGIKTKVMVFDDAWAQSDFAARVLGDNAASAFISGSAFHCYSGDAGTQSVLHDRFPHKDIWETECSPGLYAPGGNKLQQQAKLLINSTRNWARSVVLWNIALDEQNGPRTGGCASCTPMVTVGSAGKFKLNAEYYALGHASKFVIPGAYRVESTTDGDGSLQQVAFRNPDGSIVLIAENTQDVAVSFGVKWAGKSFSYTLPGGSMTTFEWAPEILPAVALYAEPGGMSIAAGGADGFALHVEPQNSSLTDVKLVCSAGTANVNCTVRPEMLSFANTEPQTATVQVSADALSASLAPGSSWRASSVVAAVIAILLLCGVLCFYGAAPSASLAVVVLAMGGLLTSCGGGNGTGVVKPISTGTTSTVTVTAMPSVGAPTVITVPVRIN